VCFKIPFSCHCDISQVTMNSWTASLIR
jgi:hypothetical protein